jgi:hypothetical protein
MFENKHSIPPFPLFPPPVFFPYFVFPFLFLYPVSLPYSYSFPPIPSSTFLFLYPVTYPSYSSEGQAFPWNLHCFLSKLYIVYSKRKYLPFAALEGKCWKVFLCSSPNLYLPRLFYLVLEFGKSGGFYFGRIKSW